jgi:2-keto-4-pentenoate hydratase/2-oxohepta-3-ene-1,7-dioic acid hydratase in catechol pathway
MVFDVATLISYISQFMTLNPGDLISTGTPPGLGLGKRPPATSKQAIRSGWEFQDSESRPSEVSMGSRLVRLKVEKCRVILKLDRWAPNDM